MEAIKPNSQIISKYVRAFVFREIAVNGVDPRDGLEKTSLRLNTRAPYTEGYKYDIYKKYHTMLQEHAKPYVQIIRQAMNDSANNLVYKQHQKDRLLPVEEDRAALLESALQKLYQTNADSNAEAFEEIVKLNGSRFDVIGFIFFLKNMECYMPISPENFDDRFSKLGISTHFSHACSWENYLYYNRLLNEIRLVLQKEIHPDFTLLDAHSFVWMLPTLELYLDDSYRIAEHKTFGKGVIKAFNKQTVVFHFNNQEKSFDLKTVLQNNILRFLSVQAISEEERQSGEKADEQLVKDLKNTSLYDCESGFVYRGVPKKKIIQEAACKASPVLQRDRQTAINALSHAGFCCEIEASHKTFIRRNSDKPYTEPHHLVPMAAYRLFEVSLDVEENIVSLCSNCHNEIHYGKYADRLIRRLYQIRKDDLHNVGIDITEEQLLELYGIHTDQQD
jgi:hypothetical protein